MSSFAERLRTLMDARGVSGGELARQVPCDPALVSRYLNGRQQPSRRMASRMDEVLGADGELTVLAEPPEANLSSGILALDPAVRCLPADADYVAGLRQATRRLVSRALNSVHN